MQILNRLTIRNLKLNKRRTIVTIIGIILATALLTAVATMAVSLKESVTLRSKKVDGDFHLLLYDMTDKEKESVINNRQVESYYETHEVGYGVLDGCVNDSKPYVYIEALDSDTFEKAEINVTSGRLPEDDSEIVISSHIKTNGGVKYNLGDKITFDIGDRTYNGKKLYQNDTYREDEQLEAKQTKTYKVVGICDRLPYGEEPRTAPGYSVITLANKADTSLNKSDIYLRFNKKALKDRYDLTADILGVDKTLFNKLNSGKLEDKEIQTLKSQLDKTHSYYINNSLIKYEAFYDSSVAFVYNMAAVVMVIIIITSAVCISNSFAISINQKTKQYGMLASIGATPRQIRKNVFFEAAFMGVIGIVAGIGGGLSASYILVVLSNKMLIDTFEMSIVYAPSLLGVLLSIVLAIVTIVLSALVPAIRASRMSPIMAINHSEDIKIKSKSLKTPKLIGKVWGEGGVLAYKNMKRNKRKYRVITISIALSVSTFIALYGFMSLLTEWREHAYSLDDRTPEGKEFWLDYFQREKAIYEKILENPVEIEGGTVKELAEKYDMSIELMIGFLDGIEDSLIVPNKVDELEEDSQVALGYDPEKLYMNMVDCNAEWLYTLPQWDKILTPERRKELYKIQKSSKTIVKPPKVGRNDPCPCGSGKKYKKCCGANA